MTACPGSIVASQGPLKEMGHRELGGRRSRKIARLEGLRLGVLGCHRPRPWSAELRTGTDFLPKGEKTRARTEYQHPFRGAVGRSEAEHVEDEEGTSMPRSSTGPEQEQKAAADGALRFGDG